MSITKAKNLTGTLRNVAKTKALEPEENERLRARLRRVIGDNYESDQDAARAAGVAQSTLSLFLAKERGAGGKVIKAIERLEQLEREKKGGAAPSQPLFVRDAASVLTKAMVDNVIKRLAQRPGWDKQRAAAAVHDVSNARADEEVLELSAIIVDYERRFGVEESTQARATTAFVEAGTTASGSHGPPIDSRRTKATVRRKVSQPPKKGDGVRARSAGK